MLIGIKISNHYGACIPKYLEMPHAEIQVNHKNKILPFKSFGIEFISMEFFADEGQPIVWRGSVLQNMINNFFYQVEWSKDLDYMIDTICCMLGNNQNVDSIGEHFVDWCENGNVFEENIDSKIYLMNLVKEKVDDLTDLLLKLYNNV